MAEIQRASDRNDDNKFWKVCMLFVYIVTYQCGSFENTVPALVFLAYETTPVRNSRYAELSLGLLYKFACLQATKL